MNIQDLIVSEGGPLHRMADRAMLWAVWREFPSSGFRSVILHIPPAYLLF